jgi:phage protein D
MAEANGSPSLATATGGVPAAAKPAKQASKKPVKKTAKKKLVRKTAKKKAAKKASAAKPVVVKKSAVVGTAAKRPKRKKARRRKLAKASRGTVPATQSATEISVDDLIAAKKVSADLGGSDRAIAALAALKKLAD